MTTLVNGALPGGLLVAVPGTVERLTPSACAAWVAARDRVRTRHGWTPTLTDGYRPLVEQERIFRERYTPAGPTSVDRVGRLWQGRRWHRRPGCATAAVPGTSHHGLAIAADVGGLGDRGSTRWTQWAAVATGLGWSHTEGDSIGEPWHWVHTDTPATPPPAPRPTSAPTTPPEDDMTPDQAATLAEIRRVLGVIAGGIAPATDGERLLVARLATLDALAGIKGDGAESRRMLGVLLGWQPAQGPEVNALTHLWGVGSAAIDTAQLAATIADAIPDDIAESVANLLSSRLAS